MDARAAAPYRSYAYDLNGFPSTLDHRDPGGSVLHDRYDWDGAGNLRRLFCVGTPQERCRADYDGTGARVSSSLSGTGHTYSYGAGLLHARAGDLLYTPGVSQRQGGVGGSLDAAKMGGIRGPRPSHGPCLFRNISKCGL